MSVSRRTTSGILWNSLEQFARRGITVLVTLLLAKFLVPEDFGLIAMMAVFLALGQTLMDSGFREALIRLESITQADYSTAFYANIVLGLVSYGILFSVAPWVANFYEESRLVELIRVASITVVIMSFQTVQVASLSRNLDFKTQLRASVPASVISGFSAVMLAWYDAGVWALIAQILLNSLLQTVFLWRYEGWRPSATFDTESLKAMYGFGSKLFLSGVVDVAFRHIYVIVIAKIFSASVAGLYFFAQKIRELVVQQLVTAIQKVTYPALASLQSDQERLKEGYRKIIIIMSVTLFPTIMYTAVLSEPLFQLFLPETWHPAVPFFQLLCLASVLIPMHSVNLNILKVRGRSDLYFYLELLKKSINALTLFATYRYGIYAILIGQIVTSIINYVPNSYFSKRLLNYGTLEQIKDCLPALIITMVSAAIAYVSMLSIGERPFVALFIGIFSMPLAYVLISLVFNRRSFLLFFYFVREQAKHRI